MDIDITKTRFYIYCAHDRLYVVDGARSPALFTVENLDSDKPIITDHTAAAAGVGALVLNSAQADLTRPGARQEQVFDAHDLSKLVYTLPGTLGMAQSALENVYALSVSTGVMASLNFVYELEGYTPVTRTLTRNAD